jgi:glutamate formiminotransferase
MDALDERADAGSKNVPGGGNELIETVPNLSEGRRPGVIDEIAAAFASGGGVLLIDRSSDPDHNRTVLTLVGPPAGLLDGAVAAAAACVRLIDLARHDGVHPRMGALDVLPFVPLRPDGMAACVALARRAAHRIAEEAGVPTYLYGAAALLPGREALPAVRGGGFAELRRTATVDPGRAPDVGGPAPHPTAGATAVGARPFLIAYNVDLDSDDLGLARRIATAVRERDGGLPAVRALGLRLPSRGRVQVSMNLTDWRLTPPAVAFAEVARLAAAAGAEVAASEIVGLLPRAAALGIDPAAIRLTGRLADHVIEERLDAAGADNPRPPR